MRVLLVSPPFYRFMGYYNRYFPYGLLIVATVVKNAGYDVMVYDADYNDRPTDIDISTVYDKSDAYLESFKNQNHPIWNEVKETVHKFQPDVIGIQVFTDFAASAFHIAKLCKKEFPSSPVVMGGPHIHVKSQESLQICPDVDFTVLGEGEMTFIELLRYIQDHSVPIESIDGIAYRQDGEIIHNKPRMVIKDLDAVPFPERSLLLNEKKYSSEDMGLLMSSRGCPFHCTYCATEKRVRYRTIDHIIAEIEQVKQKYHTTQFTIKDDTFTMNAKRVYEFCEKLKQKRLHIRWECNTRANLIDEQLLITMKSAGCNFIKIGVETGSQKILDYMNKGVSFEDMEKASKLFKKVGIHWTGYFMMGIPGETREDIQNTLDFMCKIRPDFAYIAVYQPYPGTAMFFDGIKRGLIKSDMILEDFYTRSPNGYYKQNIHIQVETMGQFEFQRIATEMKKAFHQYNTHVLRVIKTALVKIPSYLTEPKMFIEDLKKYWSY